MKPNDYHQLLSLIRDNPQLSDEIRVNALVCLLMIVKPSGDLKQNECIWFLPWVYIHNVSILHFNFFFLFSFYKVARLFKKQIEILKEKDLNSIESNDFI